MIKQNAKIVFSPKKYKKREKASFKRVEMLITKKVIAMAVAEISGSLAITFSKLNPLFAWPNLPSILFRNLSSLLSLFILFFSRFFGGQRTGGTLILIPLSVQNFRFSSCSVNLVCMNWLWVMNCVVFKCNNIELLSLLIHCSYPNLSGVKIHIHLYNSQIV